MAGCKMRYWSILCIVFYFIVVPVTPSKLNVPRVLLPLFQQFSTNFLLEVSENGCYRWTSSRPDIVQVIPVEVDEIHKCSSKAVVSAVTKEPLRNTIIVLAEEVKTGFILRCDVIVDVIKFLKIVTTTRELFMEEAPEMFEIRAEDNQGNEFTTLEGVEFQWNIENLAQAAHQVLRFITFIDSPYETPATVAKFDALGLRGHMVLIEGVKTGAAKVSVQLPHPEYSEVAKVEVVLTVVANLLLDPPDSHIVAGDTLKFRLLQMHSGKLEELPLPSAQYILDVEDSEVLMMERSTATVRGVRLGKTHVVLRDKHTLDSAVVKLPSAVVTVTQPAYLKLTLQPHNNWAVLVDQPCSIQVQVFDRNNHRIHIGDAVSVRTVLSEDYFRVYSMSRNGTVVDGETIKVGTVPVTATLESVRAIGGVEVKFTPVISAQEEMLIYPRLAVTPDHLVVPWDPSMAKYEAELTASGGDGSYSWRSLNGSVATVSQSGQVKCLGLGQTNVVVSMSRNPAVTATAQVDVLPPSHIEILKHSLEAPLLRPIILNVLLYADKADENGILIRAPFSHCKNIKFNVDISNENFFQNTTDDTKPVGKACATVAVIGKALGTSKVKISYRVQNVLLEATTEVSAFSPLEVVHPERKMTVLAVGSSRHVVWKGGPRIWLGRPAEHSRFVTADSAAVTVEEVSSASPSEHYVYSVLCKELGEFNIVLTVKNVAGNGNFKHTESTSSVKVICAKPRFISLSPEIPVNETCPYSTDSYQIVALSYKPIKVLVTITDSDGRVFDNATSLYFDWVLSSESLGYTQFDSVVVLEEKKEYNYIIPLDHYQIIHPKNKTGTLVVDATIVNYRLQLLSVLRIVPENPVFWIEDSRGNIIKPVIKNTLTIVLVNESIITPDRATVFNHPNNKVVLKVSQGSGFYKILQSSHDIAIVEYQDNSATIQVTPMSDGLLQLTILDLCLSYKAPVVEIQVLKVGSIQVEMLDLVERGKTITAVVWLYDSVDKALAVADSELLELQPHFDSTLVSVSRSSQTPSAHNHLHTQVHFTITGKELGITSITFTSGYGDREISSQPQPLQVFPPLRLIPHDITLAVGAVFQVIATGGPQPDSVLEYVSSDTSLAKVNPAGILETSKIGDLSITGMAIGYTKSTGNKIVYSKDVANVHVIQLEGVKIHSPLLKLKVGCVMPVWATGLPDKLTPLVLGSIQPPLLFKWTTSVPDIVELQHVFHATGLEVPESDQLSMRVRAVKPGRVTLHLNVTLRSPRNAAVIALSDHLDIEIFEPLMLIKPRHLQTDSLLMAPYTQLQLRTNKDSVGEVKYSVLGTGGGGGWSEGQGTAVSQNVGVVSVNRAGLVSAHAALGSATVIVHSVEEYGLKQTLLVNIQVKSVKYIMLNVKTKLTVSPNRMLYALPRGLSLDLFVSYHDNMGETFTVTPTDLRIQQNRFDTVKVVRGEMNGTLVTKLLSYGSTVVKISDEAAPKVPQDFVKLRVDHLITPSKGEMTVGDVACFSTPLLGAGQWSSGNSDVLKVDRVSGEAWALLPGQALIKYSLSDSATTSTLIHVHPIQAIIFLPLNGRNLTNWGSFSVPVVLLSEHDCSDKSSNLLASAGPCPQPPTTPSTPPPFACEIRFNSPLTPVHIHHVFDVRPDFDIHTGQYSCHFKTLASPCSNTSVLTSNVTLRAISDNLMSEPLVIPFLPAVYLPSPVLILRDQQTWTMLPVIGTPQVLDHLQVLSSDSSQISVVESKRPDCNTALFQVTVNLSPSSPLDRQHYIFVFSPLTGQNITVPVQLTVQVGGLASPCLARPAVAWYSQLEALWGQASSLISILVLLLVIWYSNIFNWARAAYPAPNIYATSTPVSVSYNGTTSPQLSTHRSFVYRQPFSDTEPVYGDPSFSHSPELTRRNRR